MAPLEIVHRAAPCRDVPVTFTLNGPERLLFDCPTGGFGSIAPFRDPIPSASCSPLSGRLVVCPI
jgi:hypothetical protein